MPSSRFCVTTYLTSRARFSYVSRLPPVAGSMPPISEVLQWAHPAAGAASCNVCGAGNYSANVLSCEPCQVGEFCTVDAVVGERCPLGFTTAGRGARTGRAGHRCTTCVVAREGVVAREEVVAREVVILSKPGALRGRDPCRALALRGWSVAA